MTESIEIQPLPHPVDAVVRVPGSKSITNRALVCAALADGTTTLAGALDSDDTRIMVAALAELGLQVQADWPAGRIEVSGCRGRLPRDKAELYVGNSGTTVRFLTALVSLGQGRFRLDGTPRMRERPIGDLLAALKQLQVDARSESGSGCPPVIIEARGLSGGTAHIRGDVSSQFLSGLLLAAPYAQDPLEIVIDGPLVSQPYVRMTLEVMRSFGVAPSLSEPGRYRFEPACYQGRQYEIEPDASAASYFWAAAAITGGSVTVSRLSTSSLQGDVRFCDCLERMGCEVRYEQDATRVSGRPLTGIDVDMNAISDTVQTLGVVALFAQGPTTIRGVGHIRHKETDRISALAAELRKLGALVEERPDGLSIEPPDSHRAGLHGAVIDTYDDHRMAMSLALAGLRVPGVIVNDPGCTAKTYPNFFGDLAALGRTGV